MYVVDLIKTKHSKSRDTSSFRFEQSREMARDLQEEFQSRLHSNSLTLWVCVYVFVCLCTLLCCFVAWLVGCDAMLIDDDGMLSMACDDGMRSCDGMTFAGCESSRE